MFKYLILGFILSMLGLTGSEVNRIDPLHKIALKVSYQVEIPEMAYGSSFAVGSYKDGTLFITNDHVCQNTRGPGFLGKNGVFKKPLNTIKPIVIDVNGSRWTAKVLKTTGASIGTNSKPAADLCIMFVEGVKVPFITLSKQSGEVGEEVFSVSGPQGIFPIIHKGFMGPLIDTGDKNLLLAQATSLAVTHGSSGGAVFDARGQVVGVVFAVMMDEEIKAGGITLIVPKDQLEGFLQEYLGQKK